MDSQVTLVDFSSRHSKAQSQRLNASTALRFDADSDHNTMLRPAECGGPSYLVLSDKYATSTTVSRMDEDGAVAVVGVVNRRSLLPDTLVLDGQRTRLSKWLVSTTSQILPATVTIAGQPYTWKPSGLNQIGMFVDSEDEPIAWYDRSYERTANGRTHRSLPSLSVREEGERFLDLVVLSCIMVDHKLRMVEKSRQLRSIGAVNVQAFASPGNIGAA